MSSTRRIVTDGYTPSATTNRTGGKSGDPNFSVDNDVDISDSWPSGFGYSSGESSEEISSYHNVYELVKDYPYWLAYLNANPHKGFDVPESLFDSLGLSNKAKDKMMGLRADYMAYNAKVLQEFIAWKNSLPESQREQAVSAGYNGDLINLQPSSVQEMNPYRGSSLDMPSGNSFEDLMNIVGGAASLFSSGASVALGMMQTLSNIGVQDAQRKNIGRVGEGLDLSNFTNSLDAAKRVYSNLAPTLSKPKDPDEIMASFSLQYPDAPDSVNKALKNYINSREFQEGLIEADTNLLDKKSAFSQAFMTNEDLQLLVGSPEYWLGIRKLANETYMKQVEKINDYLDTLDVVTQVRSSNEYASYMNDYYASLSKLGVPQLSAQSALAQNNAAIATFKTQKEFAERNRTVLESQNKRMQEYFDVLTSDKASEWKKFWAASFLLSNSFLTRFTDPSANNGAAVAPFSPVGMSQPTLPSFSLPTMK